MIQIQAIVFDIDGTLADTEDIHRQAFNQAFKETGLNWHWDQKKYRELLAISGGRERIDFYATQQANEINISAHALHAKKSDIYLAKLKQSNIKLRIGVERLLDEAIKNNIPLGIATNSSKANLDRLFEITLGSAAKRHFNTIITKDMVIEKKPLPGVYIQTIKNLGVDPSKCIAIEDTQNGNQAALKAGFKTVITTHQFTTDSCFSGASLVINQLGNPNNPCHNTQGNMYGKEYVDLALLNQIIA